MNNITPRDEALFSTIGKYNFLTTKQIQKKIFPNLKLTTVLRRLRKLEEGKLLKRLGFIHTGMRVWGNTYITAQHFNVRSSASRVNLHTLFHDVLITDIRMLLEGMSKISAWHDTRDTQNDLLGPPFDRDFHVDPSQAWRNLEQLIPDALFLAEWKGKPKAFSLELELNHKSRPRILQILTMYDRKPCIHNPLFVAKTWAIAKSYLNPAYNQMGTSKKIYVVLLKDLLEKKAEAAIYTSDGKTLDLHEILDCEGFVPSTALVKSPLGGQATGH